jgi:hypothetical protein
MFDINTGLLSSLKHLAWFRIGARLFVQKSPRSANRMNLAN